MALKKNLALALAFGLAAGAVQAQDLRIGLQDDADVLDPDQARTFVGRIVFESLCDKLVDITPDLEIIPQLATGWEFSEDGLSLTMTLRDDVVFHDGTPFNAEAAVYNLDRSRNLPESRRASEVSSIAGVEVVDDTTILITLSAPDATLLAQLSDRAGMMISPTAAEAMGLEFGLTPVCSGPYSFVERIQQDRIVLERFAGHWDAENYHFDTVTFLPIPDTTVRLANLRAGDLDMLERLAATDLGSATADAALQTAQATSLGYQAITINVGNGERAEGPLGQDARVRQALSLSIDRAVIAQVVFEGAVAPGNQPWPPTSPWYNADFPIAERDVEAARALLAEAGYPDGVDITVQVANNPVQQQVMQVVQAMAGEAGIRISLEAKEFATLLSDQTAGAYEASQVGWSGRVDPDGNLHQFVTTGGGINDSGYSNAEVDTFLNGARVSNDVDARRAAYNGASAILMEDLPIVYLYHPVWIWAMETGIDGFVPYPDGMIRLAGVTLAE
jgi:peptide/nickel transport system substrate-binding protein